MSKSIFLFVLIMIITVLIFSSISLAKDKQNSMELIRASQKLSEKQEKVPAMKVGLMITNYGSEDEEVNIGGRIEKSFFKENFMIILEGIDVVDQSFTGFLSLKYYPHIRSKVANYYGVGKAISGNADYQLFTGIDIDQNFFVEAKYINEEDKLNDSDLYFVTGFQFVY